MPKLSNLFIKHIIASIERDEYGSRLKEIMLTVWAFFVEVLKLPLTTASQLLQPIEYYVVGYNRHKINEVIPEAILYTKIATIVVSAIKQSKVPPSSIIKLDKLNSFPMPLQLRISQMLTIKSDKGDSTPLVDSSKYPTFDLSQYTSPTPKSEEDARLIAKQVLEIYKTKAKENADKDLKRKNFEEMKARKIQEGTWEENKPSKAIASYLNPRIIQADTSVNTTEKSKIDLSKLPASSQELQKKKQQMLTDAEKLGDISNKVKELETKF